MPNFIEDSDACIEALAGTLTYTNVTKGKIQTWLRQFDEPHQVVALKLLQHIRFYDTARIHSACRTLCDIVKIECGETLDKVIFMGLGSAGKSGATMLHRFRRANSMHTRKYETKFMYSSQITSIPANFDGTLVFLDDFIGSGTQATASLFDIISIAPPKSKIVFLVIAGYSSAIDEINEEIDCNIFTVDLLDDNEKLFSDTNTIFTEEEKSILKDYCELTGSRYPYGYHDIGSLVVFNDSVPNNTPSILIHDGNTWTPLFPRA